MTSHIWFPAQKNLFLPVASVKPVTIFCTNDGQNLEWRTTASFGQILSLEGPCLASFTPPPLPNWASREQ